MERLQEVSATLDENDSMAFAPSRYVKKIGSGWRARRKMSGKTYSGPVRNTAEAAMQDAQHLEEAAKVSLQRKPTKIVGV